MTYARRIARRLAALNARRAADHQKKSRRALLAERLEERSLLAGNVTGFMSDYYNAIKPVDVNNDGILAPIDALLIINELNSRGGGYQLMPLASGGNGEGETASHRNYIDVNNDGYVAPIDALLVINALNAPEGELQADDTVNYEIRLLQPGTNTPLPNNTILINNDFDVSIRVNDLHTDTGPHGVFTAYTDLLVSDKSLISVRRSEIQNFTVDGSPSDGTFTLTFSGQTTAPIALFDQFGAPLLNSVIAADVRTKLGALSSVGGVSNIAVTFAAQALSFDVHFVGAKYDTDVPEMTGAFTGTGGTGVTVTTIVTFNSAAGFTEAFRSLNLGGVGTGGPFQDSLNATDSTSGPSRFDDVGAFGPTNPTGAGLKELVRFRVKAGNTGGTVIFTPDFTDIDRPLHATGVYADPTENPLISHIDTPVLFSSAVTSSAGTTSGTVNTSLGAATSSSFFASGGSLSNTDDFYNGLLLHMTSGNANQQTKRVIDYNGTTHQFTLDTPFANAQNQPIVPTNNSSFIIDGSIIASSLIGKTPAEIPAEGKLYLKFTSGPNSGLSRQFTSFDTTTGRLGFEVPFPSAISAGETFDIKENVDGIGTLPTDITLTIVTGPVNAQPDGLTVNEDLLGNLTNTVNVLTNDSTNPAGNALTLASIGSGANGPQHGTATFSANGVVTYTPTANYNGPDSFTYTARWTSNAANTGDGLVTVTVNAVNDAPTFNMNSTLSIGEDAGAQSVALTAIAPGPAVTSESPQTVSFQATSSNSALTGAPTVNYNAGDTTGSVTFTPANNASGVATITVTATDTGGNTPPDVNNFFRTIVVTVNAVNDAPVNNLGGSAISGTPHVTATLDTQFSFGGASALSVVDPDATNMTVTLTFVGQGTLGATAQAGATVTPSNGSQTLTISGTFAAVNSTLATVKYNPVTGSLTGGTITMLSNDGGGGTDSDQIIIDVAPPDLPFARGDSFTVAEDAGPYNLDVMHSTGGTDLANSGALTTLLSATQPNVGSTSIDTHGTQALTDDTVILTVPQDFNGIVSFTYTINETPTSAQTHGDSTATVSVTITPVNDKPVAVDDNLSTAIGTALTLAAPGILGNDTDVDTGQTLSAVNISALSNPSAGTLNVGANGSLTFTPAANFGGDVSFTYQAKDNGTPNETSTNTATVRIHVAQRPVANTDSYQATEDTNLTIAAPGVLSNDTDPDNGNTNTGLTAKPAAPVVTPAGAGTVSLAADGSFVYAPGSNFFGTAKFTYQASASGRDSLFQTVTITVAEQNDPPEAIDDLGPGGNGIIVVKLFDASFADQPINVLANDSDPDNTDGISGNEDTLTVTLVTGTGAPGTTATTAAGGTVKANGTNVLYTPPANFTGPDSFTYTISDGTDTDTALVKVNVVEFVPKSVGGSVFIDLDGDGSIDSDDPGTPANEADKLLANVEIHLSGIDFTGAPLQTPVPNSTPLPYLVAFTDINGHFSFSNIRPPQGSYTLTEIQPPYLTDGQDLESSALVTKPANSNDTFSLAWTITDQSGNINSIKFTERGISVSSLTDPSGILGDYLASSTGDGVVLATNINGGGGNIWSWSLTGWDNLISASLTFDNPSDLSSALLTVTDGNGTHGPIRIYQTPGSGFARFRILGVGSNGDVIVRLDGTAAAFGFNLAAASQGSGEGEAPNVDGNYSKAADALFEKQSWA
jgi:hypothetical protein